MDLVVFGAVERGGAGGGVGAVVSGGYGKVVARQRETREKRRVEEEKGMKVRLELQSGLYICID